jgi:WD40 repeat protein
MQVRLWSVKDAECFSTLPAHSDPVTGVAFHPDGTIIASCRLAQMFWYTIRSIARPLGN